MEKKERIKFFLKEINIWWKGESFKLKNYSPRQVFLQIEKFFSLPQIIALVGLRRTGKTTLMFKMIELYLKKLNPKNILYFSFDDFSSSDIEDILAVYKEVFPELNLREDKKINIKWKS